MLWISCWIWNILHLKHILLGLTGSACHWCLWQRVENLLDSNCLLHHPPPHLQITKHSIMFLNKPCHLDSVVKAAKEITKITRGHVFPSWRMSSTVYLRLGFISQSFKSAWHIFTIRQASCCGTPNMASWRAYQNSLEVQFISGLLIKNWCLFFSGKGCSRRVESSSLSAWSIWSCESLHWSCTSESLLLYQCVQTTRVGDFTVGFW